MSQDQPRPELRNAIASSGDAIEVGLARQLGELARQMQAEPDMDHLLQRITAAVVTNIEGADHACISLFQKGTVHTRAATDDLVRRIDARESELNEGPCITSLREEVTVRSDDFEKDGRWPRFVAAAMDEGIHSMLAVQLFVREDNLGALNIYANKPNAFTEHDESAAMLLAVHAAVAVTASMTESNLRIAIESRDVIGQAKGILMERYKLSALAAFELLVVASQQTHRKLREVAEALASTGDWAS
ncbi:GAF domain-containing protein [uncultured Jatrophihabitans sp.]|uniref:GAF domain-containing protein n=1 Tax=uncultured Jatrophihabitans sp. TaxID=1610747 RepID=UPI0035CBD561